MKIRSIERLIMTPSQQIISGYLEQKKAKIYGDHIIGYRSQLPNGEYDDEGLGGIYEDLGGISNCERFNSDCLALRSGSHNW